MWVAAVNSFDRVLNLGVEAYIYIYIYIYMLIKEAVCAQDITIKSKKEQILIHKN